MRVKRGLKSFSMYKVGKDMEVFLIDLQLAGVEVRRSNTRYSNYFKLLTKIVNEYGFRTKGLRTIDYIGRTPTQNGRATFLLRIYVSPSMRVEYAAIASFRPQPLKELERFLSASGWERLFHIGILVEHAKSA